MKFTIDHQCLNTEVVVGCVAVLLVSLMLSLAYTIYLFKRRISTVEE